MRPTLFCCTTMLLYCLLISANAQSQLPKLYLDLKSVARENQIKFVDSLRFIPLEIKDGINLPAHYNIHVTEKYILVTDYMNKRLLVYLKDGKFVKNINYKKLGDGFYPGYNELTNQVTFFGNNKNYSLTPKDMVKVKLDWNNPRNKKYFKKYSIDLNDPSLSIRKNVPDEKDILRVFRLFGEYYIQGQITVSPLFKDSVDYELKMYKNNQWVKSFFPYNRINEPRYLFTQESVGFNKTDSANIHFITRPYCDTIYKMIEDSIFAAYKLVFPLENSLPASFFTRPFKNTTERDNFSRNNGWMFRQVYNFHETPRFIFLLVRYFSNAESYVYEKQTAVTYKTKNIKPDSSHFNLQLIGDFGIPRKGNRFYKPQKAGDLLSFFEQHRNIPVPKELEVFLKSKPPATAPVIVEFKFKTNP